MAAKDPPLVATSANYSSVCPCSPLNALRDARVISSSIGILKLHLSSQDQMSLRQYVACFQWAKATYSMNVLIKSSAIL